MSNIPKIRFKGFTDAWEQRKLGEIATYRNGKAHEANQLDVGTYELVNLNSISIDGGLKPSGKFIEDGSDTLQRNDLVMVLSDVGHGDLLGRVAIIPENNRYVLNQRVALLRINDDTNTYFLFSIINRYQDYFKKLGAGSSQLNISRGIVENFEVAYPNVAEQRMIADYFQSLDHLITLHQRKCDNMKKIKKFMLQKMFPKKGEKFPEIRFEGFTDAWEQRKLGEVFEQTTNFVNLSKDDIELWSLTVEDGLTPKSERYNREFLVKKDTNFKEVRPGDIVYNPMNMTLGAVGYNGMSKSVAISGYYTTMITKDGNDSYYINTWLKSPQAISLYMIYATGSLIEKQRVQFPTLSTIPAVFPKYEEQHKIGCYFEAIDHLITLHQRKSDELKEMKKYMLQNMFPDGRK